MMRLVAGGAEERVVLRGRGILILARALRNVRSFCTDGD